MQKAIKNPIKKTYSWKTDCIDISKLENVSIFNELQRIIPKVIGKETSDSSGVQKCTRKKIESCTDAWKDK